MRQAVFVAILGLLILTQYVNCSSYSDNTLYAGSGDLSSTAVTGYQGIRVLNGDTYMNCNEDHVQIGGSCNTGDAYESYIEYKIFRDRVQLTWGSPTTSSVLSTYCEDGRFYAIVPKPNDDAALNNTGTGYIEYQTQFQIFTKVKGAASWSAGQLSPYFPVYIQPHHASGFCN